MSQPTSPAADVLCEASVAAPRNDATPTPGHRLLLEVNHVSKTFRARGGQLVHAVRDASLVVGVGETVAIVGESGSGKSSLARIVLGLTPPDAGEVMLDGLPLDARDRQRLRQRRRAMQPIFQDSAAAFNPRRTVFEALRMAVRQAPGGAPHDERAAVARLLEQVRLVPAQNFMDRLPHELSGGQRQRLGIARAIAVEPRLIVADEPLSGADISIRGQVLNLLLDLQRDRQTSYLFITHDIGVAREFAHRVVVMYKGEIVEQGPAGPLFDAPRHAYTRSLVEASVELH